MKTSTGPCRETGTRCLHKRHQVGANRLGQAVVLDQHAIDRLYLSKQLSVQQHNVANQYLGLISKSGAFGGSVSWERIFTDHNSSPKPFHRSVVLLKVQRLISQECGNEDEKIFWALMVGNPIEIRDGVVNIAQRCCDTLINFWGLGESPSEGFLQALPDHT